MIFGFQCLKLLHDNLGGIFAGLGSNINDICGRDWVYGGGDHGDPGNNFEVLTLCFY